MQEKSFQVRAIWEVDATSPEAAAELADQYQMEAGEIWYEVSEKEVGKKPKKTVTIVVKNGKARRK